MHYGSNFFSKNGKPTIITKDSHFQSVIGNRDGLSFYDVMLANRMYQCDAGCDVTIPCPVNSFR